MLRPTVLGRMYAQELAHKLAMQVVGAVPRYLKRSQVPSAALEEESKLLREQALKSGEAGWVWRSPAQSSKV